jgi:glycine oxidase
MTDFIIVGRGLAATTLMHTFHKHQISFRVIADPDLSVCSKVAAGIWNPVVFKRMTKSWMADALIPSLNAYYGDCEKKLGIKLITERSIIKPFTENQEKALWKKKQESELCEFVDPVICSPGEELKNYKIPNQYGIVKYSGNLDMAAYLSASAGFFNSAISHEIFDHHQLIISEKSVQYKEHQARNIIFCEGFLVQQNPFFKWIPLKPAKGELLTIELHDPGLQTAIFNRDGFLMNVRGNEFKLGATYEWTDLSKEITQKGEEELIRKMKAITDKDFTILKQETGIRPSSIDRRPIIGRHPKHSTLFVFNGLGTKGVMLSPFFSENFVNFYLEKQPLHPEIDLKRFYHLYE